LLDSLLQEIEKLFGILVNLTANCLFLIWIVFNI